MIHWPVWQYNEPGAVQGHQGWSPEATYELAPASQDNWLAPADPDYAAADVGRRLINDGCMGETGGISWGDSIGLRLAMSGFTLGEDILNMQPQRKFVFYIAKCLLEEWRIATLSNDGEAPSYVKTVSDVWIRTMRDGWLSAAEAIKISAPEIPIAEIMDIQGREGEVTHAILEGFTAAVRSMSPDEINQTWTGELTQANMRPALEFSVRDLAPFRGNVPNGWFTTSRGWGWYSDAWLPDPATPNHTSDSQTQIDFFLGEKGPLAKLFGETAWAAQSAVPGPAQQVAAQQVAAQQVAAPAKPMESVPEIGDESTISGSSSDDGDVLSEPIVKSLAEAKGISQPNVEGMSEGQTASTIADISSITASDSDRSSEGSTLEYSKQSSRGMEPSTEKEGLYVSDSSPSASGQVPSCEWSSTERTCDGIYKF